MQAKLFKGFARNETVYLVRYNRGTYRDGIFSGTVAFRRRMSDVSIQPVTEADELIMPDGLTRTTSIVKVYSTEPLYTAIPDKGVQSDEIEVAGVVYKIDSVNNYSFGNLPHYESIAVKVDR